MPRHPGAATPGAFFQLGRVDAGPGPGLASTARTPFTGLLVRLLGPGVSLGLHSAEIEALRGEFTDAVMMRGYDRVASRFTPDSAMRMPDIPVGLADREEIRAGASGYRQP